MFNELDELLSYNDTTDYWYDDGFCYAQSILSEFSDDDWKKLSDIILLKNLEYQKKLVYCLDSENEIHELEIIEKLLSVDDEELFIMCVDSLRDFNNLGEWIKRNPFIIDTVKAKSDGKTSATVIENFLRKADSKS